MAAEPSPPATDPPVVSPGDAAPLPSAVLPADGTRPQPGVKRAALTGAAWIMVGQLASYVLRLFSSVVLTRLIHPEVYGLMGLADVCSGGLHMFSDIGLGPAAVQSPRGEEPDFLNTGWTIQILRGALLWLAAALIAWPVSQFYEQPLLLWLLPAVGISALVDGLASTSRYVMDRRLYRGRLVATEVGGAVVNLLVILAGVWLAYPELVAALWHGQEPKPPLDLRLVWAVVAGSLAASLLALVVSHLFYLPGFRNRLRWDPTAVRELLRFGKWVFFSTLVTFLAFQSDRLLVPKLMSFDAAGVYGRATSLSGLATGLMASLAIQLIFPTYARLQQKGRDIRTVFVPVHTAAASFGAMLVTGMLAAGPAAVRFLYGADYHEAGWMLQFLALGAWFQMLQGTAGASLLALGQARSLLVTNGARLLGFLIFVPLFWWAGSKLGPPPPAAGAALMYWEGGFIGLLLGFGAADAVSYLVTLRMAHGEGMSAWLYDIGLSVLIVAYSVVGHAVGQGAVRLMQGGAPPTRWHPLAEFVCAGCTVVLLWAATVACGRYSGRFRLQPR